MDELPYGAILDRVGELVERLAATDDPAVAGAVEELVDWLDAFHRDGIGRLVEMIREWRGDLFLEQAALDPVVGELLATYDLGVDVDAVTIERTVQAALDEVRPYVQSHGGAVEVVAVADGVVRLRMSGHCDGCTGSDETVSRRIAESLRAHWIDFRAVELEPHTAEPHPPPVTGQVVSGLEIMERPR